MSRWYFKIYFIIVIVVAIGTIVSVVIGEDNLVKYNKERDSAINGCVQCKLQEGNNYYFYTCNGSEFWTLRENWVKLNASICK